MRNRDILIRCVICGSCGRSREEDDFVRDPDDCDACVDSKRSEREFQQLVEAAEEKLKEDEYQALKRWFLREASIQASP